MWAWRPGLCKLVSLPLLASCILLLIPLPEKISFHKHNPGNMRMVQQLVVQAEEPQRKRWESQLYPTETVQEETDLTIYHQTPDSHANRARFTAIRSTVLFAKIQAKKSFHSTCFMFHGEPTGILHLWRRGAFGFCGLPKGINLLVSSKGS
eukprot:gb/GECG01014358.1/.p1 GENE.gb/GECG01014358.1/~~gb/GECG01014358.1/.p1  ORF type:complete len:151 (+),score=7.35 gb/GECG01014358.1/:1-453(+)